MKLIDSQDNPRRKLLKTVVIGSGTLGVSGVIKDKWLTPVIDAVILPAHAQTSGSGRYFMLDPVYPIHSQAQTGVSAQLASADATQNNSSITDKLAELLISSVNAKPTQLPSSSTARLEMFLQRIQQDRYKFVFSMTAIEGGLTLVLFGDELLQVGNGTIHLALCAGDPKPFPVVLEALSDDSASILIAGESFKLGADPAASAPVKKSCS